MNNIKSVADFFRKAKCHNVIRHQVGGLTTDEWDEWVANAKTQLIAQGVNEENIIETDSMLKINGSSQYWRKPNQPRVLTGNIVERSKDYIFNFENDGEQHASYGNKKGLKVKDNNLIVVMFNQAELHYSIVA